MTIEVDYWMISVVQEALELLKQKRMKDGDYNRTAKHYANKHGLQKTKEAISELETNKFHPLGQIAITNNIFQKAKEVKI